MSDEEIDMSDTSEFRRTKKTIPAILCFGKPGPNLLVIEAKKSSDLKVENEDFDYLRLRAYKDELHFRQAAFIMFVTDAAAPDYTVDFRLRDFKGRFRIRRK